MTVRKGLLSCWVTQPRGTVSLGVGGTTVDGGTRTLDPLPFRRVKI